MDDIKFNKLSEQAKVELLESAVIENDLEKAKYIINGCKKFEFTARTLGIACKYSSVEMVKLLIKSGATFKFEYDAVLKRKYGAAEVTVVDTYPAKYYLMLADNGNAVWPTYHFGYLPELKCSENDIKTRIEILEFLISNFKKYGINCELLLYYAVLWGNKEVVDFLEKQGIKLNDFMVMILTDPSNRMLKWYRDELIATLYKLPKDVCVYAFNKFTSLLGNDKKIAITQSMFESNDTRNKPVNTTLLEHEVLKVLTEKTDISRINKTSLLEYVILEEKLDSLSVLSEWIKAPAQRDKLIEFATKNKKNLALAWLMDYKNKTADIVAETKAREAKELKELTEDPNSVSAMKKIWNYKKLPNETLEITKYKGDATEVTIPTSIGKNTVSSIGEKAFERCKSLEKVEIPSAIETIGSFAFLACENLKEVVLPKKIKNMGEHIFCSCDLLKDSNGFIVIDNILFDYHGNAEDIVIPEGVVEIATGTFKSCFIKPSSLNFPDSLEIIGEDAFMGMIFSAFNITIPPTVKVVKKNAFCPREYDYSPRHITILGDNIKLERNAFGPYNNSSTIYAHIPNNNAAREYMMKYKNIEFVED